MKQALLLGTARVEITPPFPVPLAGFAFRQGAFEAIHSPLFLRALLFSRGAGRGPAALLISADVLCWGPDTAPLHDALAESLGIPPGSVILHATHNHSGPQTSRCFSVLGAADERYLGLLREAALRAVATAAQNVEPVTVELGSGWCSFAIHRRRIENGVVRMAPNPEGPLDPEVTVVRFRAPSGRPKALLVHYTCHPTTSGANQVCGEFPGLAMAALERESTLVAAFLQGCCGDVRPALIRDGEFYRGDGADAAVLAGELESEIRHVLADRMTPCEPGLFAVRQLSTPLPLQPAPGVEDLRHLAAAEGLAGQWARLLLEKPDRLTWSPALESTRLDLARGFGLLTFNAEMVVAYGLETRRVSQGTLLPVGYTGGMLGYVPTRRQIAEGGYEPAEAFQYYGYPAAFAGAVETAVSNHIERLAARGAIPIR